MFNKNVVAPAIIEANSIEPVFRPVLATPLSSTEETYFSAPLPKKKWYHKVGRLLAAYYGTLVVGVIIVALCL